MRNKPILPFASVLLLVTVVISCAGEVREFVYLWYPRNGDLPADQTSREVVLLRLLVQLVETKSYTVEKGDNLDFIIRKNFLVSSSLPHAYAIYMARILQLNPSLVNSTLLTPGATLTLPRGPKYGGTEIESRDLPAKAKTGAFLRMSQNAYFGPSRPSYNLKSPELQDRVTSSLGQFVLPDKAAISEANPDIAYKAIVARGIVAPIDKLKHPEQNLNQAQPLRLQTRDDSARRALLGTAKDGNLFPGFIPSSANQVVSCPSPCTSCADLLKMPAGTNISRARILIEDTGIDPAVLTDKTHLIYTEPNDDGSDAAQDHHGTYVYSEMAASQKGIIPDNQLYVAKVAYKNGCPGAGSTTTGITSSGDGSVNYCIADILLGWRKFAQLMDSSGTAVNTWVINLSAEGPVPDDTFPMPAPPVNKKELLVAAAGNEGNGLSPLNNPFDNLSNPGVGLLIVGALSPAGQPTIYTNFHETNVQLFAQGDCVCGTPNQSLNGTSQAAPIVAVAAAVLASANPSWGPAQVMWRLLSTADRPKSLNLKALAGQVNLARALGPVVAATVDGQASPIVGVSTSVSSDWEAAVQTAQQGHGLKILRFFDRQSTGSNYSFSYLEFKSFIPGKITFPPAASITITDISGNSQTFSVGQLSDIILPVPVPQP